MIPSSHTRSPRESRPARPSVVPRKTTPGFAPVAGQPNQSRPSRLGLVDEQHGGPPDAEVVIVMDDAPTPARRSSATDNLASREVVLAPPQPPQPPQPESTLATIEAELKTTASEVPQTAPDPEPDPHIEQGIVAAGLLVGPDGITVAGARRAIVSSRAAAFLRAHEAVLAAAVRALVVGSVVRAQRLAKVRRVAVKAHSVGKNLLPLLL